MQSRSSCTRHRITMLAALLLLTRLCLAQVPAIPSPDVWTPNGEINAIRIHNGHAYIGGRITAWGPYNAGYAAVDPVTGRVLSGFPALNYPTAIIDDGAGGWYVAEPPLVFQRGQLPPTRILHLGSGGAIIDSVSLDLQGKDQSQETGMYIYTMHIQGDTLILGGRFDRVNGEARFNLAAVRFSTGEVLDWNPEWQPDSVGYITNILRSGRYLVVTGSFGYIGQKQPYGITRIDAATGKIQEWPASFPEDIRKYNGQTVAVSNGIVYTPNGAANVETGVAVNWKAVPDLAPGDPYFWAGIWDIRIAEGRIYVSGAFNTINGEIRHGLAAFDEATGQLLDWNPNAAWKGDVNHFYAQIQSIAVMNDVVYIAGGFSQFNGDRNDNGFTAVSAITGEEIEWPVASPPWNENLDQPNDLLYAGNGVVFVRGRYATVGYPYLVREGLAEMDVATGAITDWDPRITSITYDTIRDRTIKGAYAVVRINALRLSGSTMYVGGIFDSVDGHAHSRLAAFDVESHTLLPWSPQVSGRTVSDIAYADGVIYIAGNFSAVNGSLRRNVAAIDAVTGELLNWNPGASRDVDRILVDHGRVYLGGKFDTVGGEVRNGFAIVDGVNGSVIRSGPEFPFGAQVVSMLVSDSIVYLSGSRLGLTIPPFSEPRLGGFSLATGEVIWSPHNDIGNVSVKAQEMQLIKGQLYMCGQLTDVDPQTGKSRDGGEGMVVFDLVTGMLQEQGPTARDVGRDHCRTFAMVGDTLYLGGTFRQMAGNRTQYLARFVSSPVALVVRAEEASVKHAMLSIYPNPSSTSITIDCSACRLPATLHVVDGLGREVYSTAVKSSSHALSVSDLPNGIYRVRVGDVSSGFVVAR